MTDPIAEPTGQEYKLLANLPFADPETEVVTRIGAGLAQPVTPGPEGAPEINSNRFLAYAFVPDDVDRKAAADLFGLSTNLTLVVTDPEADDERVADPIVESIVRIALLLAAVPGGSGLIVTDYTASSIVLRFADGQLTFNQDWPGWQGAPDALALAPAPRRMASLRGRS
jgi:hypothetical protein